MLEGKSKRRRLAAGAYLGGFWREGKGGGLQRIKKRKKKVSHLLIEKDTDREGV